METKLVGDIRFRQRTEEVSDIVDHMPTYFGRLVTMIVLFILSIILFFGWIVKYPEVKTGQIVISARRANIRLFAQSTGKLDILHTINGSYVKAGSYIAMIKNPANVDDVRFMDSLLVKFDFGDVLNRKRGIKFPMNLVLGELSSKYFAFVNSLFQYKDYYDKLPFDKQKEITKTLMTSRKHLLKESNFLDLKINERANVAKKMTERDSVLFENELISAEDLEKSTMNKIGNELDIGSAKKDIINGAYQIEEALNKLLQLDIQKSDKEGQLEIQLYNSYFDLLEYKKEWEVKYIIKAPISGKVDFLNFLKNDDFIQAGQELLTIVPNENEVYGQVFLPEWGAGRVKVGQEVIIKLDNYPYTEFGSIHGVVRKISLVTNLQALSTKDKSTSSYLVIVDLPNGLTTNYGSRLDFRFESKGIAEIITDRRRLIERLFDNLKYKIK